MKTLLTAALFAGTLACTHTESEKSARTADTSTEATAKGGWEETKEGAKKAGEGMGEVAQAAADSIESGAKEAGHSIKSTACPVVADKSSGRYYKKGDKNYEEMLKGEKVLGNDMRECFTSEDNAKEDGYQSVGR